MRELINCWLLYLSMQPPNQQLQEHRNFSINDLKLYVYGSRESDQFWLQGGKSHSRRPFCLTTVEEFEFDDEEEDEAKDPIPNPLFNVPVLQIACGGLHSVILTTSGKVYTMGCNDEGALGRKGIECIPQPVIIEDPIDMVAAGDNHSLFANSKNGAIYFTGNYNYKRGEKMTTSVYDPVREFAEEINISNRHKPIQKITCGANHSIILVNNKIFCRGEPEASTTGRRMSKRHKVENSLTFNGVALSHVEDVECGGYHTLVKCLKGKHYQYFAWGTNDMGQLGIGSFENQPFPVEITQLKNKNIVKMAAGSAFSLFLTEEGEVYGCGSNEDGNLGLGEDYRYFSEDEEEEDSAKPDQPQEKAGQQGQNPVVVEKKEHKTQQAMNKAVVEEKMSSMEVPIDQQISQQMSERISAEINPMEKPSESMNRPVEKPSESQMPVEEKGQSLEAKKEKDLYIKSIRKIQKLTEQIQNISCGQNFSFAWNDKQLYTWGFGSSYVLLNGEEEDEPVPFKVKSKIINNHKIHDLQAGSQHVVFLSYPEDVKSESVEVKAEPSVWENLSMNKKKHRRR